MLDKSISDNLNKILQSCLVIDIETSAFYPSDNREINIKSDFENYLKYAKIKWVGLYSFRDDKSYYLNAKNDTQQILTIISEHSTLVGFNLTDFDYPILVNNGFVDLDKKHLQVDCMTILGDSTFKNKDGYKFKGRANLMGYQLKGHSLKSIAKVMELETQKGEIDFHIFQKNQWSIEEEKEIISYLSSDVMATKQMFQKLWEYWQPFSELLEVKNVYDLSWIRSSIASLTYKAACRVLNTDPTYAEGKTEAESMGGHVIMPKYEELKGVWYVDVGSLYPHMFAMGNLTAEVNPDNISSKRKVWHGNEVFQVKGYYDITEWHPLAKYIASKLRERIALKETDPKNPFIYTLKIFLNGLYGVMRSPIFEKVHTPNCGWDCCYLGQQCQALIKEMLEQFGFEVVMGDTDSCFFIAKEGTDNSREYVQECLIQIAEIIKDNFPYPVDTFKIGVEHYLDYLMVPFEEQTIELEDGSNKKEGGRLVYERRGKKKNYLMIYKDKEETVVKLVGLPIKKDNSTALGIKIFDEVLKPEIIKNTRAKFPKSFIESKVNEYLQRPEAMELISQEYKVNTFSSYKTNCIQAQISKGYFKGMDGVIRLVKNQKVGSAGKGDLYCTIQEAIDAKLSIKELNLDKVFNELEPFCLYEPEKAVKEACKILAKDDKALTELAEAYLAIPEEPKKKRGRPKKNLTTAT
jgi:DNA polymerase elongation subunit (family B)